MAENSKIEWTDHTHNEWRGCRKVSDECANCYIVTTVPFRTTGQKHGAVRVRAIESTRKKPYQWNAAAAKRGVRERVFSLSLGDWLDDENVPAEWLAELLKTIRETPSLDWLLLTKRPQNWSDRLHEAMRVIHDETDAWISSWLDGEAPENVWIGVSVGADQSAASDIPARIHFLSAEPMLRRLDSPRLKEFDWCILGGESGPSARPCNIDWIRDGVRQCRAAGVAPFVKQLGAKPYSLADKISFRGSNSRELMPGLPHVCFLRHLNDPKGGDWSEWPEDLRVREFPKEAA